MEFVIVHYPEAREVILDGTPCGNTEDLLRIEAGPHIFTLSDPQNYEPPQYDLVVEDTTPAKPLEVIFAPV